jgi:hypothetical protein
MSTEIPAGSFAELGLPAPLMQALDDEGDGKK